MNDRDCEKCKHHTEKGCDSWDCKFERKVTRKETIKVFENMKKGIYPYDPNVYLDIAINSLEIDERYELEYEQIEPCEDAISRQAVLDATVNKNSIWNSVTNSKGENLEKIISQLPSVNPQEPKTDVLDKIRAEIEKKIVKRPWLDFEDGERDRNDAFLEVLDIIDKYRKESEEV